MKLVYTFQKEIGKFENEQLKGYVRELYQACEEQNLHQALAALWKGLSVADLCTDEEMVVKLLHKARDLSFYLAEDSSFQYLIESLIACNWKNKCIKVELFFILSILHLQQQAFDQSYVAAKLGYYYASKLSLKETDISLCNAQLQLTFVMLYTDKIVHIEDLLQYFEWYVENCKTVGEQLVLDTIQTMIVLAENKVDERMIMELTNKLTCTAVSFHSLYLVMHLYYFCRKLNLYNLMKSLQAIFEVRKMEYFQQSSTFDKMMQSKKRLHSEQFFNDMTKSFQKSILQQAFIAMFIIKGSPDMIYEMNEKLIKKDKEGFLLAKEIKEQEYYVYISSAMHIVIDQPNVEIVNALYYNETHYRFLAMYKEFLQQWER